MWPKRTRQRGAFLRLGHDQTGVAEFVAAVPERNLYAERGAEVIDRLELDAGNAKRQDRRRVMVTHRVYIRPRFVDFTMDDALAGKNGLGDFEVAGVAAALEIGGGGAVDGEILGLERAPFHAALPDPGDRKSV